MEEPFSCCSLRAVRRYYVLANRFRHLTDDAGRVCPVTGRGVHRVQHPDQRQLPLRRNGPITGHRPRRHPPPSRHAGQGAGAARALETRTRCGCVCLLWVVVMLTLAAGEPLLCRARLPLFHAPLLLLIYYYF
eukprot:6049107-Pyramimonas_sp.AAC.2